MKEILFDQIGEMEEIEMEELTELEIKRQVKRERGVLNKSWI